MHIHIIKQFRAALRQEQGRPQSKSFTSEFQQYRPIARLFTAIESATTPAQLRRALNDLQEQLWRVTAQEQSPLHGQFPLRAGLIGALRNHILNTEQPTLRLAAASWLRFFIHTGFIHQPHECIELLVTAIARLQGEEPQVVEERRALLNMLLDCFWPFRFHSDQTPWQRFPTNDLFYPLAERIAEMDEEAQDTLLCLFAELPIQYDLHIIRHLLPLALAWAQHPEAERRKRSVSILALLNVEQARDALRRLQLDADPLVSGNARRAVTTFRTARPPSKKG